MKIPGAFQIKTHVENPVTLAIESIKKNRCDVTLGRKLSLKKLIEKGRR